MENRIKELDFLKCVFILLMIIFHLGYFADKHLYLKQMVYTFHMPAFLLISGYLVNVGKDAPSFWKNLLWIFVPYSLMEIGYVMMASLLPIREHINNVDLWVLLEKVFCHPLGPYWYLHTIILCEASYYIVFKWKSRQILFRFLLLGLLLYTLSLPSLGFISFANALYFLIGVVIRQSGNTFFAVFKASLLSLVPLVFLCSFPANLNRFSLAGVAITYLVISLLLFTYSYIPERMKAVMGYVGKNTLVILLFSPVFTLLSKSFIPFFSFDSSGWCFMCVALLFVLAGCFSIAYALDWLRVSAFFFGKKKILG